MSSEGGPSQPAGGSSDKPQAPKAAAPGFSSFINKSGASKKFAPKVARRRPGNAAPSAPSAPSSDVTPAASSVGTPEQTVPATEPEPESRPQVPQPDLPTPLATQESTSFGHAQASQTTTTPLNASPEPTATSGSNLRVPDATPDPSNAQHTLTQNDDDGARSQLSSKRPALSDSTEIDSDSGRSTKRPRLDNQVSEGLLTGAVETAVMVAPPIQNDEDIVGSLKAQSQSTSTESVDQSTIPTRESTETRQESDGVTEGRATSETQATEASQSTILNEVGAQKDPQWNAVNRPMQEGDELVDADVAPQSTRAKRKRNATSTTVTEGAQLEGAQNSEQSTRPKPRRTRAKAARQTTEGGDENDANGNENENENGTSSAPPAQKTKKTRKTRKDKGATRTDTSQGEEAGEQDAEANEPRPKRRKTTRKKKDTSTQAGEGEEPRRRGGRPPREPTPSDAEDEMIDPSAMQMFGLSRDLRQGKLSEREKKMREINWTEVRERWREEAAMDTSKDARNAIDAELETAGEARGALATQQETGPMLRVVDGNITWVQSVTNTQKDRDAIIDRELDEMVEVQEDDLTTRITSKSFLKSNKRFPNEFILPGQGARWTTEGTEQFYDALQTFGTDFTMIATIFPGIPRRSIKSKFNREERENPSRIRKVLNEPRPAANWEDYLLQVGRTTDSYVDPDEIQRQLLEERAAMEVEIAAAKEAVEEERRQRIAAGLDVDEDVPGGDENDGTTGKKRKKNKRDKQPGFAMESGVEIVDDVEGFSD